MNLKFIAWLVLTLCVAGIIFSIDLIIKGIQPCSSDGCMIQILVVVGVLVLIPSLLIALLIIFKGIKNKRTKNLD